MTHPASIQHQFNGALFVREARNVLRTNLNPTVQRFLTESTLLKTIELCWTRSYINFIISEIGDDNFVDNSPFKNFWIENMVWRVPNPLYTRNTSRCIPAFDGLITSPVHVLTGPVPVRSLYPGIGKFDRSDFNLSTVDRFLNFKILHYLLIFF